MGVWTFKIPGFHQLLAAIAKNGSAKLVAEPFFQ
jgi:hypothetical protein